MHRKLNNVVESQIVGDILTCISQEIHKFCYASASQVCSYCLNISQNQLNVALTMHKLNIGKLLNIGKY